MNFGDSNPSSDDADYLSRAVGTAGDRLRAWASSWPGRAVLAAEKSILDVVLPNLFGYYLLQVGALSHPDAARASRIRSRICVLDTRARSSDESVVLCASPQALPVATDSVDVIVLQHVLEFAPVPHEALREAERVLVPEGCLILSGFNPFSLFGAWGASGRRRQSVPWSGRFVGVNRAKDWLALLGFEVSEVRMAFFRPPFSNPTLLRRLRRLEPLGARFWSYAGGVYVVVARKRVTTLTPIKPRWLPRRSVVGIRLAEPSARRTALTSGARPHVRPGSAM